MNAAGWVWLGLAVGLLLAVFHSPRSDTPRQAGCHASVLPECAGRQR